MLHTDDIAWHQGVFAWDALLINDVLPVVRSGRRLRYRPPAWEQRQREGAVELAGELNFLIIEGVGASQPSVRDELDVIIWVETDEPTRAARDAMRIAAGETTPSGLSALDGRRERVRRRASALAGRGLPDRGRRFDRS